MARHGNSAILENIKGICIVEYYMHGQCYTHEKYFMFFSPLIKKYGRGWRNF